MANRSAMHSFRWETVGGVPQHTQLFTDADLFKLALAHLTRAHVPHGDGRDGAR
jgi:hypothetical protein